MTNYSYYSLSGLEAAGLCTYITNAFLTLRAKGLLRLLCVCVCVCEVEIMLCFIFDSEAQHIKR